MTGQRPVWRNEWSSLDVPDIGAWTPTKTVSLMIPAWQADRTLPFVLAGLAAQTYPAHLLEVVVVDDGNTPPLTLPEVRPDSTRVVRIEHGWGQSNALRTGIETTDGEVILRLDADMLVYRDHVEAHLRWHHLLDYAVVLGSKRFVDPAGLGRRTPEEVRDLVAQGRAAELFDLVDSEPHTWVEGMWERTDDLRSAGTRGFRSHVGATGSMTRSLYDDAGGFDASLTLGEDIELGYRLGEAGGVLVPERDAQSWHLGRSAVMQHREEINRHNDAALANLVPGMRPKRNRNGRIYEVPYLEVVVTVPTEGDWSACDVIGCVDSVLDSTLGDLRVVLVGAWSQITGERRSMLADPLLELRILERTYHPDPRVELVEVLPPGRCRSPFRLTLESVAWAPLPEALLALLEDLERTHEGWRLIERVGHVVRTAALSRAARVLGPETEDSSLHRVVDETYAGQSISAAEAGWVKTSDRVVPRYDGKLRPPVAPKASRAKLRKALSRAGLASSPSEPDLDSSATEPGKRGIFNRRR